LIADSIPDEKKTNEFKIFEEKLQEVPEEKPELAVSDELRQEKEKLKINYEAD